MIPRLGVRHRAAWVALVVLVCCAVASLRVYRFREPRRVRDVACVAAGRDSARTARLAVDTVAALRARTQQVRLFARAPGGVEVRTEDKDTLATHDGGLVAFDCAGRLTFLWLDGG